MYAYRPTCILSSDYELYNLALKLWFNLYIFYEVHTARQVGLGYDHGLVILRMWLQLPLSQIKLCDHTEECRINL